MKAPIAIVVFNRPDHVTKLIEHLKPESDRDLFVISDGARTNKPGEADKVNACRNMFNDWPGKIYRTFADHNMGCKARISSGLTWVFEHTDKAIILEEDCLPHPDFFKFADDLLDRYANNSLVMSICGTKTFPVNAGELSAVFSKYNNCWGWATWRRAWSQYDEYFDSYSWLDIFYKISSFLGSYRAGLYWCIILHKLLKGTLNSWAYCWMITCFLKGGIHIYPTSNLIVNAGVGDDATHTIKITDYMPQQYGTKLLFPISVPVRTAPLESVDKWIEDNMYSKSLRVRIKWLLGKVID